MGGTPGGLQDRQVLAGDSEGSSSQAGWEAGDTSGTPQHSLQTRDNPTAQGKDCREGPAPASPPSPSTLLPEPRKNGLWDTMAVAHGSCQLSRLKHSPSRHRAALLALAPAEAAGAGRSWSGSGGHRLVIPALGMLPAIAP